MVIDLKSYLYAKGSNPQLDAQFSSAQKYGKVRLGADFLFWRAAFKQYVIPLDRVQRIHRRIHTVVQRLCAGGRNYDMEYLVLILKDGGELVVHITDAEKQTAIDLLTALQNNHPEIAYGKE